MKARFLLPLLLLCGSAQAQQFSMPPPAGVVVMGIRVVAACGAESYTANTMPAFGEMDVTGKLCVNATVSTTATVTGFPTIQSTGTPIAVTTSATAGTLPAGTEVVASNTGPTNTAFCKLGNAATTSDQPIAPNSWFGFTVGANTQIACVTSASGTTINLVGGSGLPTGAGGGGGSSGGGAASTVNPTTPAQWGIAATASGVPANAVYLGINSAGNLAGWNGAVTQSGTWNSRTQDGSGNGITSDARGTEQALTTQIVDANGNQITVFGGNSNITQVSSNNVAVVGNNNDAQSPATSGYVPSIAYNYGFNGTSWDRLQVDGSKNLKVNIAAGLNVNGAKTGANSAPVVLNTDIAAVPTNVSSLAGVTLGAPSTYGTSPGPVPVQGVNAFVTNGPASEYPSGAVPITASTSGTTGAITVTLTSSSGHTAFVCSISYRANATAALTSAITMTGIINGTVNYMAWIAPLANGIGVTEPLYSPCMPAAAQSTNITITTPAPGSGGSETLVANGYLISGNGY